MPGQELFGYESAEGNSVDVKSDDVNEYIREIAGAEFSAKDFRTWAGTVAAAGLLAVQTATPDHRPTKRNLAGVVKGVAERLGNTPAVCRKCYIHPAIIDGYLAGETIRLPVNGEGQSRARIALSPVERAVLALLERKAREPRATLTEQLQRSVRANSTNARTARRPAHPRTRARSALPSQSHGRRGRARAIA